MAQRERAGTTSTWRLRCAAAAAALASVLVEIIFVGSWPKWAPEARDPLLVRVIVAAVAAVALLLNVSAIAMVGTAFLIGRFGLYFLGANNAYAWAGALYVLSFLLSVWIGLAELRTGLHARRARLR